MSTRAAAQGFRIRRTAAGQWMAELIDQDGARAWQRTGLPTIDAAIEAVEALRRVRVGPHHARARPQQLPASTP